MLHHAGHLAAQHKAAQLQHTVDQPAAQRLHQHAQRQVHQLRGVGKFVGGVGQPVGHHTGQVVGVEPTRHAFEVAGLDFATGLCRFEKAGDGLAQALARRQGLGQHRQRRAPRQTAHLGHKFTVGQQALQHGVGQALQLFLQLIAR